MADLLNPWYLFHKARTTLQFLFIMTNRKSYRVKNILSNILIRDGSVQECNQQLNVKRHCWNTNYRRGPQYRLDESKINSNNNLPKGFDSYLGGPNVVVPAAIGLAAAALRYSLLQISNIEQITPGTLGNCLQFLQTMQDVGPGANGTEADAQAGTLQKPVKHWTSR